MAAVNRLPAWFRDSDPPEDHWMASGESQNGAVASSRYPAFKVPVAKVVAAWEQAFKRWGNTIDAFCEHADVSDTALKSFRKGETGSLTPTVRKACLGLRIDPEALAFKGKVVQLPELAGDEIDALYRLLKREYPAEVAAVLRSLQAVHSRHTGSP